MIADWRQIGAFPLQDHDPEKPDLGIRQAIVGFRVAKMPDPSRQSDPEQLWVEYAKDGAFGTIGDLHPWLFWQTAGKDKRPMGSWAQVFGGVTVKAQTSGGESGDPTAAEVGLIRNRDWQHDKRLKTKTMDTPEGLPGIPRGALCIVLAAMEEREQHELVYNVDPRLVAANVSGPYEMGTLVCDMQPERELCMDGSTTPGFGGRHARLQSMMRVISFAPEGSGGTTGIGNGGNGLAWNLALSGDELNGFGMVFSRAEPGFAGPTTPGAGGGSTGGGTGPTTPGAGGGASFLLGDAATGGDENLGKKLHEFGAFQPRPVGGHCVSFMAHMGASGPYHGGAVHDKHWIGNDRDGHPMNAGHIATRAYFFDDQDRDAPLLFEGKYPYPPEYPHTVAVHLAYDRMMGHPFVGGVRYGMWRWYATVPFIAPPGGGNPPTTTPPNGPSRPGSPSSPTPPTPTTPGPPGVPTPPGPRVPAPPTGPTPPRGPVTPGVPPPGSPWSPGYGPGGVSPTTPGGTITGGSSPPGPTAPPPSGPEIEWFEEQARKDKRKPKTGPVTPRGGGPTAPPPSGPAIEWFRQHLNDPIVAGGNGSAQLLLPLREGPVGRPDYAAPDQDLPDQPSHLFPGEVPVVGQVQTNDRALYVVSFPMMTGFSAMAFRPQLWVGGYPSFEHGPTNGSAMRLAERCQPQVMAARAWGAQDSAVGDWDYTKQPNNSRARGGTADGGLLFGPPEFEMEDYVGLGSANVRAPSTQSYITAAPGVSFALGTPVLDGGLTAGSVTIGQSTATNYPVSIAQLNSSRVAVTLFRGTLDQSSGEVVAEAGTGGTQALRIPRGTTGQRPSAITPTGGEIRVNSSGAQDVLEFWDQNTSTWRTVGGRQVFIFEGSSASSAQTSLDMTHGGLSIATVGIPVSVATTLLDIAVACRFDNTPSGDGTVTLQKRVAGVWTTQATFSFQTS